MPTNSTTTPDNIDADSPMFAPIPSWERNRKRRGFGATRPAAMTPDAEAVMASDRLDEAALGESAFAGTPTYASSTAARRNNSAAPLAIAAGIIALGGLAAAGWYSMQPHETGVAQLTPGVTSTTTTVSGGATQAAPTDVASNDAAAPPAETAAVSPPAGATHTVTTRTTTARATPARARPAASRSVGDAGVNASATLPAGPQPYSGSASNPATVNPAPAPLAPNPAPTASTPAPAAIAPVTPDASTTTAPPAPADTAPAAQ